MKKLILILLLPTILFSKPLIVINVHTSDYSNLIYASAYGTLGKKRFEILLEDALKKLGLEMKLQDLFSSKNEVLNKKTEKPLELNIYVEDLTIDILKEKNNYIENNASGEYIKVYDKYIKVYVGKWFDKNGQLTKDGLYVKGVDGNFYYPSTFYTKFSHTIEYYTIKGHIRYVFKGKEETILLDSNLKKKWYKWNEAVKSPISMEKSFNYVIDYLAKKIGNDLLENLNYKTKAKIANMNDNRVILNVGKDDGINTNTAFEIDENAQIIVKNVEKNFSEGEILYLKKGTQLHVGDELVEGKRKISIPISLGLYYSTQGAYFSIELVQKNIHHEKVAFFALEFSDKQSYSLGVRVLNFEDLDLFFTYNPGYLGFFVKYKLFDLLFKFNGTDFVLGGGISW